MLRTRLMVAGLMIAAAACSNDSGTNPGDDALITADVATAAADGIAEDVAMMTMMDGTISASAASLNGGGDWRPGLTGCNFASGTFACPALTRNGLTVVRAVTLLDASGAPQSFYDALTTASIHVVADISGEVTHGPWSATVARHRDFTVTGLAETETTRTVNGTGSEMVSHSRSTNNPRAYDIVGSSAAVNVVLPVRSADNSNNWPISGTITRTLTITVTAGGNAGHVVTRTVSITFNGTSSVTATVNGVEFTIDLTGRTATPRG